MAYIPASNSVVGFQSQPSSLLVGASIIGVTPVSGNIFIAGSVATVGSITALQGTSPWLITGSVATLEPGGIRITSLVSIIPSSVMVSASIFGTVPVTQVTSPWVINVPTPSYLSIQPGGSIINANLSGSVATAVINFTASVAANINVISASIVTNQGTNPWVIGSIVGTYAEDAPHTTADKGVFIMGVRNDATSSITSTERDYSPMAVDEIGRTIITPFAGNYACIISYTGSTVSGSVTLIQASVIGSRSYLTDFWVANTGSVANLITFQGGDTSVLAYTIAPGGGGSNAIGIAIPPRTTLSQDLAWKATVNGTISSVIYMTVKGYQAP